MTLQVFEWNSFAANNSSDHRLIATFETSASAKAMAEELATLFATHAEQVQQADDDEDSDWDPWDLDPSPSLREFAAKYGSSFSEGLMWGDEGCSSEDLPEIATLGDKLLLYHGYMSGGFGGDLDEILSKAGATEVVVESGPPWLQFTVTAESGKAGELFEAVAAFLKQREEHDNLCDFETPWGDELPIEKTIDNIVMVPSDDGAIFTIAMGAEAIAGCRAWLTANHAKEIVVEVVGDSDIEALHARELAAADGGGEESLFDPSGKSFLFTGKLSSMTRAEAQFRVEELGGAVAKSVNKSLDVLVIGDEGSPLFGGGKKGSKQIKAEKLIADGQALQIISETDFMKLGRGDDTGSPGAEVDIDIPRKVPSLVCLRSREQGAAQETVYFKGMTSAGDTLYATGSSTVLRSESGKSWDVIRNAKDHSVWETSGRNSRWKSGEIGYHGIHASLGELWVGGTGFVLSSTDDSTFTKHDLDADTRIFSVGRDADGCIWAVGDGAWLRRPDGGDFEAVKVAGKSELHAVCTTPFGMLVCNGNGNVFFGTAGAKSAKLKKTGLRAKSPLYAACVTKSGAVVVVGHGDWKGAAYRTADGTAFDKSSLPIKKQLHSIACLPDGRLIAGGNDGTLLISYDDGRSFELIDHEFRGKSDGRDGNTLEYPRSYQFVVPHNDTVIAMGSFQFTLAID